MWIARHRQLRTMQTPVLVAVVKITFDPVADDKPILLVDRHVSGVKDAMDVAPKQNSI